MKYIITYTAYDRIEFDEMDAEEQGERTRVKEFSSKNKALGFCEGVEALNGTVLKKEKSK